MSQDADRTLVQWAKFLTSHNTDGFLSLFTDDCVYEDVALGVVNHGKNELRVFIEGIFAAFPDFGIDLTYWFVANDRAAMEWVFYGTHHGDLLECLPHTKRSRFVEPPLPILTRQRSGAIPTTGTLVHF
jgi:steroid delta-isomerase-like uncharacterized protein